MPPMPTGSIHVRPLLLAGLLLLLLASASPPATRAGGSEGGPFPQAVFTASDFPTLAEGIAAKASGEFTVHAWAPANAGWKLSQDGDTVKLTRSETAGDGSPVWQKLGKVATRSGHPLK